MSSSLPSSSSSSGGLGLPFMLAVMALPAVVYYLWISMRYHGGTLLPARCRLRALLAEVPLPSWRDGDLFDLGAGAASASAVRAGSAVSGGSARRRTAPAYRLNGWFSWWLTLLVVLVLVWRGVIPATLLLRRAGVAAHRRQYRLAAVRGVPASLSWLHRAAANEAAWTAVPRLLCWRGLKTRASARWI